MRFFHGTCNFGVWLSAGVLDEDGLVLVLDEFEAARVWLEQQLTGNSILLDAVPADVRRYLLGDVLLVLVTGYDSSTALLGNALAALAADAAARDRLAADPALSARAAEELIRYDSTGQVSFRIATGEMVALLNGSGNRDEMIRERADQLDFDRPKRRPLSFGSAGPHACVGAALAKTQFIGFLDGMRPWLARLDIAADASTAAASQHDLLGRRDVLAGQLRHSSHQVFPESKTNII